MSMGTLLGIIVQQCHVTIRLADQLGVAASLLMLTVGCASEHRPFLDSDRESGWQPWQVVDTQTGRVLSSSEWLNELAAYDVV